MFQAAEVCPAHHFGPLTLSVRKQYNSHAFRPSSPHHPKQEERFPLPIVAQNLWPGALPQGMCPSPSPAICSHMIHGLPSFPLADLAKLWSQLAQGDGSHICQLLLISQGPYLSNTIEAGSDRKLTQIRVRGQ